MLPDMRKFINIIENDVEESYSDDTQSKDIKIKKRNIDLFTLKKDFQKENDQLASYYKISNKETIESIRRYADGSSINDELIKAGEANELNQEFRAEYSQLISLYGTRLREDHHVYSGTGNFDPRQLNHHGKFKTPAFLSTSLSIKVAVKTTNFRREDEEDHIIHLDLKKNFGGGFYIAPYSINPEEYEFLIFPDVPFIYKETTISDLDGIARHIHTFESAR